MQQPLLFQPVAIEVSELTRYLRQLLESDEILQNVWVRGEISNLSLPRSGHVYFTLKDQDAALRCVIWRPNAITILRRIRLQDGLQIVAHGGVGVYEKSGQYQLYIDAVQSAGEGVLYQEFMRLKAALDAEGLFDESRKRPLPEQPRSIGIVTSPTGAALQDILNTLSSRYPLARVILSPTAVQGDAAPPEIVTAIEILNRRVKPDVIILARGGGSLEDLWAFNDERVVRAVVASRAPVVTGVGHETDFTLVDFAADARAPTPTGAAMMATPDIAEIAANLAWLRLRLLDGYREKADYLQVELDEIRLRLRHLSPDWRIKNSLQRLDELSERVFRACQNRIQLLHVSSTGLQNRLAALNPESVLKRGYAIVKRSDGSVVSSTSQVRPGVQVHVRVSDGKFSARVDDGSETSG
ncbi:MAG: exodeoxyribonuclease VII large subunit [Anaerolineaceae bacterium]|nr:exodeoxyribonuclease VII large subunit [Anaerolineaceae bacterium]